MIDYLYSRALGTVVSIALTAAILVSITGLSVSSEIDSMKEVAIGLAGLIDEIGGSESGTIRMELSLRQLCNDKGMRVHLYRTLIIAENDRTSFSKNLGSGIDIHHDGEPVEWTTCQYDSILRIELSGHDLAAGADRVRVSVFSLSYLSFVNSPSAATNMSASEAVL